MDALLANLDLAAYGVAAPVIVALWYIYSQEKADRKFWQEQAFQSNRETAKELLEAFRTLDKALDFIKCQ